MTSINTDKYYSSLSRAPSLESVANKNRPMRNHPKAPLIIDIKADSPDVQDIKSDNEEDSTGRKRSLSGSGPSKRKRKRRLTMDNENDIENSHSIENTVNTPANSGKDENDDLQIWSDDVEVAFREALEIIPKHGLNKIKISGRTCGRNELVADYILSKTGKVRTRKQISSHIQVLKNLNKDKRLMKLIIDGPDDDQETKEKFSEIFGNISLRKSMGINENGSSISSTNAEKSNNNSVSPNGDESWKHNNADGQEGYEAKDDFSHQVSKRQLQNIVLEFNKFEMQFTNQYGNHNLTNLPESFLENPLKIRDNANISSRFPKLYQVIHDVEKDISANSYPDSDGFDEDSIVASSNINTIKPQIIPIFHGMVNILPPSSEQTQASDLTCKSNSIITLRNIPTQDEKFMCLTLIYSSGKLSLTTFEKLEYDVLSSSETGKDINLKVKLAPNYWVGFFKDLYRLIGMKYFSDPDFNIDLDSASKTGNLVAKGIRRITMKQIIFTVSTKTFESPFNVSSDQPNNTKMNFNIIKPRNIRSIVLWEFNKVNHPEEANMSLRSIYLPSDTPNHFPVLPSAVVSAMSANTSDSNFSPSEMTPPTPNSSDSYNNQPMFKETHPDFNDNFPASNFNFPEENHLSGSVNSNILSHQYDDNQSQLQKLDMQDLSLSPSSPQLEVGGVDGVDVSLPIQMNQLPLQSLSSSTALSNNGSTPLGFNNFAPDLQDLNLSLNLPMSAQAETLDNSIPMPTYSSNSPTVSTVGPSAISTTPRSSLGDGINGNITTIKPSLPFPTSSSSLSNRQKPASLNLSASVSNFTLNNNNPMNSSSNGNQERQRNSSITTSNANGTVITTESGMGNTTSTTIPMMDTISGGLLNNKELIATPYLTQFPGGLGNPSGVVNSTGLGNQGGFSFY